MCVCVCVYVLLSLNVSIAVLWDVVPYRFGRAVCLHSHGRRVIVSIRFAENISVFFFKKYAV